MASRRRELTTDNDPWRVSAFVSALMELLLSVLLLLGAFIASITSQLVKYFGLEPPCTYFGCSHPPVPRSSKRRRLSVPRHYRHPKLDHLSHGFPDRRHPWVYTKLQLQSDGFASSDGNTDGPLYSEESDPASGRSIAVSGASDTSLNETHIVPDDHLDKIFESPVTSTICRKPSWRRYGASVSYDNGKPWAKEEATPLVSTRPVAAFTRDDNTDEDCRPSSPSSDDLRKVSSQREKLQRCFLTDFDASTCTDNKHEHVYTLVENEEPSGRNYMKLDAVSVASDRSQSPGEESLPPHFKKSVSVCSSDSDTGDDCQMSVRQTDHLKEGRGLRRACVDANVTLFRDPELECLYVLSEDEELSRHKNVKHNTAIFTRNRLQFSKEECVPLFRPFVTANGSISDAENCSEILSVSMDESKKKTLQELLGGGTLVENMVPEYKDAGLEHHYVLLKDEEDEAYDTPIFDSIRGLSGDFQDEHHAMIVEGKDEERAKILAFKLQRKSTQSLLESISEHRTEVCKSSTMLDLGKKFAKKVVAPDNQGSSDIDQIHENCPQSTQCEQSILDVGKKVARKVVDPDNQGSSDIDHIDEYCAQSAQCEQLENIEGTVCARACDLVSWTPNEDEGTDPAVRSPEALAIGESILEVRRFDILHKAQTSIGSPADETTMDTIGFESGNAGNTRVADQIREHGALKGDRVKDLLQCFLDVHVLQKENIDDTSSAFPLELRNLLPNDFKFDKAEEMKLSESGLGSLLDDPSLGGEEVVEKLESISVNLLTAGRHVCDDEVYLHGECTSKVSLKLNTKGVNVYAFLNRGMEESLILNNLTHVAEEMSGESTMSKGRDLLSQQMLLHSQVMVADQEQDKEETQTEEDHEEALDSLRQALQSERKILAALETELENERNAAAIATSEAMAMISRLQEEKSAMQLEVAQLQRMSEEKADYDEQAMELLKEILLKRDKEKHALEKEVEFYRERFLAEKGDIVEDSSAEKECKDVSMPVVTPVLRLRGIDECYESLSCQEKNGRLQALPSLEAFYDSGTPSSPNVPYMGQNLACDRHLVSSLLPAELNEPKASKAQQAGTCLPGQRPRSLAESSVNGVHGHHTIHQEPRETSKSMFSTNDEETQFILERLWVLEEELQELGGGDVGLGVLSETHGSLGQWKSDLSGRSDSSFVSCLEGEGEEEEEVETGGGMMFSQIHDVYEVQSTRYLHGEGVKGSDLSEYSEDVMQDVESISRDISAEYMAVSKQNHRPQNNSDKILIEGSHCDSALDFNQDSPCAGGDSRKRSLKTSEDRLVTTDAVQQLVVRLQQALETDRELLRDIMESFRQKGAELRLLHEIARHFRELQATGFRTAPPISVPEAPFLPIFDESCGGALKKRRYCSGSGQVQAFLLQQKSI